MCVIRIGYLSQLFQHEDMDSVGLTESGDIWYLSHGDTLYKMTRWCTMPQGGRFRFLLDFIFTFGRNIAWQG